MLSNLIGFSDASTLHGHFEFSFVEKEVLGSSVFFYPLLDFIEVREKIIIYFAYEPNINFLKAWKELKNKVVLIHPGDELGQKNLDSYVWVDYIVRNYFIERIMDDERWNNKIQWLPNGYKNGVGPKELFELLPAASRKYIAGFLGWIDNPNSYNQERLAFSKIVNGCAPDFFYQPTEGFGRGFGYGLYNSMTTNFAFSPAPAGNSPETLRLYDSLELGCIPIILSHGFTSDHRGLANPPFAFLNSWDELPSFLDVQRRRLENDPHSINEWQEQVYSWWVGLKSKLKIKLRNRMFSLLK